MQLSEFKIKNFRSIIDSGWNSLSSDNITALIGQNESGKTSVLEALCSFYEGSISEDVLRSDLSQPEVYCSFNLNETDPAEFIDISRMPAEVMTAIKSQKKVVLRRKWHADMTSQVFLSGDAIGNVCDAIETKRSASRNRELEKIKKIFKDFRDKDETIIEDEKRATDLRKSIKKANIKIASLKRVSILTFNPDKKEINRHDIESALKEYSLKTDELKDTEARLYKNKTFLTDSAHLRSYCEKCLRSIDHLRLKESELANTYSQIEEAEKNRSFLSDKEKKASLARLFRLKEEYININSQIKMLRESSELNIRITIMLIEGEDIETAENNSRQELDAINSVYSLSEAGEIFFNNIPCFEFFEDFSSLLPNRMDLQDIFENNHKVEGYKAVRNFLIVAGLDPDFFKQINNRILKQKIENLNNEVTIDFQEYWRQNLGKTNKIKIHFELEHYDNTHPDKKGKPYLEFWVKDEQERLYPKQRSRGVRWFLSFYLELKAFARENSDRRRVLLIDEPGLSLHARAQEDVLKVFEDIKGKIQIIYTTHSPHLIDNKKLYRIIAVQRSGRKDDRSETVIFDAAHLHAASSDTLSPVSSILGAGFPMQEMVKKRKNIIVEDITSYYYMTAINALSKESIQINYLPATGPAGVATLVNLLTGWGLNFSVLLFDNDYNRDIIAGLGPDLPGLTISGPNSRLILMDNIFSPEDLFSTLDFKKFILKKRIGISGLNSSFIASNDIPRTLLAANMAQEATSGSISLDDFDEESRQNFSNILSLL
jgi:predicted ATP-dependent endonuclease of OLD family